MRLLEAAKPTFARHETFHPRYGWFRKAFSAVAEDPHIFNAQEAPVVLGVGKNMVRSIRFWGLAAKLITPRPKSHSRRAVGNVPTRFGNALFGERGWDRYMEDPGTLWLLHWRLLAAPSNLPVWWLAFNEFQAVEFSEEDLETTSEVVLEAVADWSKPHRSSVKKDLSVLLRTYAPTDSSRRASVEDLLDCPLRELNLMSRLAATGRYRFTLGPKATLPSAVVCHAVLDYVSRAGTGGNTVTLNRVSREPGAPGLAFKLNEDELRAAIEPTIERTAALSLTSPTGATQLAWSEDPAKIATMLLDDYFNTSTSVVCAGPEGDQPADNQLDDVNQNLQVRAGVR